MLINGARVVDFRDDFTHGLRKARENARIIHVLLVADRTEPIVKLYIRVYVISIEPPLLHKNLALHKK